jgi:hypothetical protein
MRRFIIALIIVCFLSTTIAPVSVRAQMLALPEAGAAVPLSAAVTPAHLKGLVIDTKNPFAFDFIFHKGSKALSAEEKKIQYTALVKYFLTALTVPDADQWVNLSPYENKRIIAENFGATEMGRDLLSQDYLLKQMMATLSNPETDLGQVFWARVYEQAQQKFGTTNIPTSLLNKVWISPKSADLYEKDNIVYIMDQKLNVQLESDYLAMKENAMGNTDAYATLTKDVMREVLLPALEKEVNEGQTFARLRQMYSGMLLAAWYKNALQESLLVKMYGDQSKTNGIQQDPANNQRIYEQYIASFKKGVVNLIREETDAISNEMMPRKYFSGGAVGFDQAMGNPAIVTRHTTMAVVAASDVAQMEVGHVDVLPAAPSVDMTAPDAAQKSASEKSKWRRKMGVKDLTPEDKERFDRTVKSLPSHVRNAMRSLNAASEIIKSGAATIVLGKDFVQVYFTEESRTGDREEKVTQALTTDSIKGAAFNKNGNAFLVYDEKGMVVFHRSDDLETGDAIISGRWTYVRSDFEFSLKNLSVKPAFAKDGFHIVYRYEDAKGKLTAGSYSIFSNRAPGEDFAQQSVSWAPVEIRPGSRIYADMGSSEEIQKVVERSDTRAAVVIRQNSLDLVFLKAEAAGDEKFTLARQVLRIGLPDIQDIVYGEDGKSFFVYNEKRIVVLHDVNKGALANVLDTDWRYDIYDRPEGAASFRHSPVFIDDGERVQIRYSSSNNVAGIISRIFNAKIFLKQVKDRAQKNAKDEVSRGFLLDVINQADVLGETKSVGESDLAFYQSELLDAAQGVMWDKGALVEGSPAATVIGGASLVNKVLIRRDSRMLIALTTNKFYLFYPEIQLFNAGQFMETQKYISYALSGIEDVILADDGESLLVYGKDKVLVLRHARVPHGEHSGVNVWTGQAYERKPNVKGFTRAPKFRDDGTVIIASRTDDDNVVWLDPLSFEGNVLQATNLIDAAQAGTGARGDFSDSVQDVSDAAPVVSVSQRNSSLVDVIYSARDVRKVITRNNKELLIAETASRVFLFYTEKQVAAFGAERNTQKYAVLEFGDIEDMVLSEDGQSLLVYNKDKIALLRHVRPYFGANKGSSVNAWESAVYARPANVAFFLKMPWFDKEGKVQIAYQASDTNETAFIRDTFQGQYLDSNIADLERVEDALNSRNSEAQPAEVMDAAQESGRAAAIDFQEEIAGFKIVGWTPVDDGLEFKPSDYEVRGPGWAPKGKPSFTPLTGIIGKSLRQGDRIIYMAASETNGRSAESVVAIGNNFAKVHYRDQDRQGGLIPKIRENRLQNIKGVILDQRGQAFAVYNASQLVVFYVPTEASSKNQWFVHLRGFPEDFDVMDPTSAFDTNGTAFLFKYTNKEGKPMEQRFDLSTAPVLPSGERFQRVDMAQKSEKAKPEHAPLQWNRIYKYDVLKHKTRMQIKKVGKVLHVVVSNNGHNLAIIGDHKTSLNFVERRSSEDSPAEEVEQTLKVGLRNTIDAVFNNQGTAFLIYSKKAMILFRRIYEDTGTEAVKNRWVAQRIPFLAPLKRMPQRPTFSKDGKAVKYSYVKNSEQIQRVSISFNEDSDVNVDGLLEIFDFAQKTVLKTGVNNDALENLGWVEVKTSVPLKKQLHPVTGRQGMRIFSSKAEGVTARVMSEPGKVSLFFEESQDGRNLQHTIIAPFPSVEAEAPLLVFNNEGNAFVAYDQQKMVIFFRVDASTVTLRNNEFTVLGRWQAVTVALPRILQTSEMRVSVATNGSVVAALDVPQITFDNEGVSLGADALMTKPVIIPLLWRDSGRKVNMTELKKGIEGAGNNPTHILEDRFRLGDWRKELSFDNLMADQQDMVLRLERHKRVKTPFDWLMTFLTNNRDLWSRWSKDFGGAGQIVSSNDGQAVIAVGSKKVVVYYRGFEKLENKNLKSSLDMKEVTLDEMKKIAFNEQGDVFFVQDKNTLSLFSWQKPHQEGRNFGVWQLKKIDLPNALKDTKLTFSEDGLHIVGQRDGEKDWELQYRAADGSTQALRVSDLAALKGEDITLMFNAVEEKDAAALSENLASTDDAEVYGGIDFARDNLQMNIRRDGNGVPLPVSQQDLEAIHIDGLVPLLGDIRPAATLAIFARQ